MGFEPSGYELKTFLTLIVGKSIAGLSAFV
jgi:hypothetical protein